jgi:hypothetical protein
VNTRDQTIEAECSYDLVVGAVFRNEAPYLKEWIEFHKLVGVQHFVLINDRSDDDFEAVLRPYVEAGEVDLVSEPSPVHLQTLGWLGYQLEAVCAMVVGSVGVARWLALIDLDEFIVPGPFDTLVDALAEYEEFGGVYVRWNQFGTSGIRKLAADRLLTEQLRCRSATPNAEELGKSIVKPHRVRLPNIHECALVPGYAYADCGVDSRIVINHYWSRDEEFLIDRKIPRKQRVRGWDVDAETVERIKSLFNDVRDDSMGRFLPELRRRVFAHANDGVKCA